MRLETGQEWTQIHEKLLQDLAQLTKANSIEGIFAKIFSCLSLLIILRLGNKKNNITVIYTPWSNLKKTGDMAVGQVGFHNSKLVSLFVSIHDTDSIATCVLGQKSARRKKNK